MMDDGISIIAGDVGSRAHVHIEYQRGEGITSEDPMEWVIIVTRISHKLSLKHDILDTDIDDRLAIPISGQAGGSRTIEMKTTCFIGCGSMELLCPKGKRNRTR